jgi:hypothetical protein
MLRTWRILALATLMAGPLPAIAGDAGKSSDDPATKADLPSIAKKLDEINKSLRRMDDFVQQELLKLREGARELNAKVTQAEADVLELRRQLALLQQNVDALSRRVGNVQTQMSGYAGLPGVATPTTGRIRLVNTFPQAMTIRINNTDYAVLPGQERVEAIPTGNFTYEVLGVSAPVVRSLTAGETFTVTVYPR